MVKGWARCTTAPASWSAETQFFANVSHELHAPGAHPRPTDCSLARARGEQRSELRTIQRARQLLSEVDDLLEVSRLERVAPS